MSEPCAACPCAAVCRRLPAYCRWAAEDPPDPIRIRHICAASSRTGTPAERRTVAPRMAPADSSPPVVGDDADRPTVAEAVALTRAVAACPYRSTGPGCGCAGARCSLRRGAGVSHRDCFACVRAYGP